MWRWGVGSGVRSRGLGVRKVGVGGGWGSDHDTDLAPFSKLPTPISLHTFRVKSSLHQIILTSRLFASNRPRQIVMYPNILKGGAGWKMWASPLNKISTNFRPSAWV